MTNPNAPQADLPYVPGPRTPPPPQGYPPFAPPGAPVPPRPPVAKGSSGRLLFGVGGLLVGLVLGGICGGVIGSAGKQDSAGAGAGAGAGASPRVTTVYVTAPAAAGAAATTAAAPPPATTAAAPPPPAGPKTSFGDGTYEVNVDIAPGTYKTTVPDSSRNCYWEREKDLNGEFDSIIANANAKPGSPVTVKILKSDAGFKSSGCGTWNKTA